LIFTLVDAKRTLPGSNRKTFEVGEFLNFEDEELTLPDPKAVPNQVDLQHNTNLLDLSDAGLSEDEIEDLNQKSATKKKELENQFASLQAQVSDKQIEISENQKRLNETRKLISAVSEIVASDDDLLVRLQDREEDLLAERDTLIVSTNDLNTQSKQVLDSLINVSEIVR
jgi:chromosome segregation ATPase